MTHIDRTTAEQLLTGRPAWPTDADPRLLGLLAAVAAPPRHAELAGEQAAVEAFRSYRQRPAPTLGRLQMMKIHLAKLFTVKVLAATVGVVGAGGAAFAASTGTLPAPVQNAVHDMVGAPAAQATRHPKVGSSGLPSASPSVTASADAKSGPGGAAGHQSAPTPSFAGLCKAWLAHPMNERGKAASSSAFTALVTAAGGPDKVVAYCKALPVTSASPSPTASASSAPAEPGKSGEKGASGEAPGAANRPTDKAARD